MRKIIAAALFSLLSLPALAEVKIDAINVVDSNQVEIRLLNTGTVTEKVANVSLRIRDGKSRRWLTVKTWNEPIFLEPGDTVAVQIKPESGSLLGKSLASQRYELQALASTQYTPGMEAADH